MGVKGLWPVLSKSCSEGVPVENLAGKTVAVDLASWICEFRKAGDPQNLYIRNLFYRTIELLRCGVKLVFVGEGTAVPIKQAMLEKRKAVYGSGSASGDTSRSWFISFQRKCEELLKCFGLPFVCIKTESEGEGVCAALNEAGLVDGVLTSDTDAFLYGARTVYRNYQKGKKGYTVDVYTMEAIQSKLSLNRDDLIVIAMVSGCDYNEKGVSSMGPMKTIEMIKEMKKCGLSPLQRVKSWREDEDLENLQNTPNKKGPHCKTCSHSGKMKEHASNGCDDCHTVVDCIKQNDPQCSCLWHRQKVHELELRARSKALKDSDFPKTEIEKEYYRYKGILGSPDVKLKALDLKQLHLFMVIHVKRMAEDFYKIMSSVLVHLQLKVYKNILFNTKFTPHHIVKSCTRSFQPCYEVQWNKLTEDRITKEDFYTVDVDRELMQSAFPLLVSDFEAEKRLKASEKQKGRKRPLKVAEENQPTLKQFYPAKKKKVME